MNSTRHNELYSDIFVKRLIHEIFRQAVYDWSYTECQDEIEEFFQSDWAEELSDLIDVTPTSALTRLVSGEIIDPKDFYSGAGPQLDRYLLTKNNRRAGLMLSDQSFTL
jgi:hypothetical protein